VPADLRRLLTQSKPTSRPLLAGADQGPTSSRLPRRDNEASTFKSWFRRTGLGAGSVLRVPPRVARARGQNRLRSFTRATGQD